MNEGLSQSDAYTYALRGAEEGLWRAIDTRDVVSLRDAAAIHYNAALEVAALIDQLQGRPAAEWAAPVSPADYPPELLG